jgi:hypothetical protein
MDMAATESGGAATAPITNAVGNGISGDADQATTPTTNVVNGTRPTGAPAQPTRDPGDSRGGSDEANDPLLQARHHLLTRGFPAPAREQTECPDSSAPGRQA